MSGSGLDCGSTASRTSRPCEDQVVAHSEQEIATTIKLPALQSAACQTSIRFGFSQRNTVVRVEGTLENGTCAASNGEYSVSLRIKTATGEVKTLEFPESWKRADDQPLAIKADYPIGENVDLLSVRMRSLRCTCTAAP